MKLLFQHLYRSHNFITKIRVLQFFTIVTMDLQVDINKLEIYWPHTVYFYPTHLFSTSELKTLIVRHIFVVFVFVFLQCTKGDYLWDIDLFSQQVIKSIQNYLFVTVKCNTTEIIHKCEIYCKELLIKQFIELVRINILFNCYPMAL